MPRQPMVSADAYDSVPASPSADAGHSPSRVAGRYDVVTEIGRGGMACVLQVVDTATGRALALKRLLPQPDDKRQSQSAALFEREFHALAQLHHPRVIRVYEYGLDELGPYYTMELLDGGDLRELSPLPWRKACELMFDVCSALALLHSRRLVHRDISPRNIRCTQDGQAKLIDFGAMLPMGAAAQVVGTPAFVAPEVVLGSAIDARTDLYSLGATLYYALTGKLAFAARGFADLYELWTHKPPLPSAFDPDLPASLDRLVGALISREPALRPRSAHEVMQHLETIAGIQRQAPVSESQAHLVMPSLVGREQWLSTVRRALQRAKGGRGRSYLVAGPTGVGRSRALEAAVLEAKLLGATVARTRAGAEQPADFAVAHALAASLLDGAPHAAAAAAQQAGSAELLFEPSAVQGSPEQPPVLRSFARTALERAALQKALLDWLIAFSQHSPLVLALDDVHEADESSVALLASVSERAKKQRVLVIASALAAPDSSVSAALAALRSRSEPVPLAPLGLAQTEALLSSVFGDVPNLALLSDRLYAVAAGLPRQTLVLAQHLVDHGVIRYAAGSWSLPLQLSATDLPATEQDAIAARVAQIGPSARGLLHAQALALHGAFSRQDYQRLEPDADPRALDRALQELVGSGLVTTDGRVYTLVNRPALAALVAALDPDTQQACHRRLAALFRAGDRPPWQSVRQLLLAGESDGAFEHLLPILRVPRTALETPAVDGMSFAAIGATLRLALSSAVASGRSKTDQFELRRWMLLASVSAADDALYWDHAAPFLAQMEHDSGLADWRALGHVADPAQRLTQALQQALQRHAQTPEPERVYALEKAIRSLVEYVAVSIATGMRSLDVRLMRTLPGLLEPFAPLSPILSAVWQNAIASYESAADRASERVIARWREVYEQLGQVTTGDMDIVQDIRFAAAYAIGTSEASLGLPSAVIWADILETDSFQRMSALYLRKIVSLQQGDFARAEQYSKQAELLGLQMHARQMLTVQLALELGVHAAVWDLTGVKQIAQRIEPLAQRYPGWVPFRHLADGHHRRLRGDLEGAAQAYARCMALVDPVDPQDPNVEQAIIAWPLAATGYAETLVSLRREGEARACAQRVLSECRAHGMQASCHDVERALALAEAKLGDYAGAAARLERIVEQQQALGIAGLNLGATYETRARIAIWAHDQQALEHYARLCAEQYRHGHGSPLGARYEWLLEEARAAGVFMAAAPSAFETTLLGKYEKTGDSPRLNLRLAMQSAQDPEARAQQALQLLCEAGQSEAGHLFVGAGRELRWACSHGALAPGPDLQRRARELWERLSGEWETQTALVTQAGGATGDQLWPDLLGVRFQPALLSAVQGQRLLHAGIVLLSVSSGQRRAPAPEVLSAVAQVLLRDHDEMSSDDA